MQDILESVTPEKLRVGDTIILNAQRYPVLAIAPYAGGSHSLNVQITTHEAVALDRTQKVQRLSHFNSPILITYEGYYDVLGSKTFTLLHRGSMFYANIDQRTEVASVQLRGETILIPATCYMHAKQVRVVSHQADTSSSSELKWVGVDFDPHTDNPHNSDSVLFAVGSNQSIEPKTIS